MSKPLLVGLVACVAVLRVGLLAASSPASGGTKKDSAAAIEHFEARIRPVLARQCAACHGERGTKKGGLALDSRAGLLKGGDNGPAIDTANATTSLLTDQGRWRELNLPASCRLSDSQRRDFIAWIESGAVWPKQQAQPASAPDDAGSALWSLQPVELPAIPKVGPAWPRTPVDNFVLKELEAAGLQPAPAADKAVWLRRVTYDLIGLPPTPEEIADFVGDPSESAYEQVVDRLLASPHYGERWGRHWLDLVRYADTNGMDFDVVKPNAFRYRDYVIRAFNDDLPYDQFVREQIAGDMLAESRSSADGSEIESLVGSGFHWFGEMMDVTNEEAANEIENQIDVLGKCFLGLTISCARCHDHKFDPFPQTDYDALARTLRRSTNWEQCVDSPAKQERIRETVEELSAVDRQIGELADWPGIEKQLIAECQSAAQQTASYLLATRDVLAGAAAATDSQRVEQAAARHRVDAARLRRLVNRLNSATEADDPVFWSYAALCRFEERRLPSRAQSLGRYLRETAGLGAQTKPSGGEEQNTGLAADGEPIANFEDGLQGWIVEGEAFRSEPVDPSAVHVVGAEGRRVVSSNRSSPKLTGRLISPPIKVTKPYLTFLIAGGNKPEKVGVYPVYRTDAVPLTRIEYGVTGYDTNRMERRSINLVTLLGQEIRIEIVDEDSSEWGHVTVDDFRFADKPPDAVDPDKPPPSALPSYVKAFLAEELTRERIESHAQLANVYQALITTALAAWQSSAETESAGWIANELAQYGGPRTPPLFGDRALESVCGAALSQDSPLLGDDGVERFLPTDQRQRLRQLGTKRQELERQLQPSTMALVSRAENRLNQDAIFPPDKDAPPAGPFFAACSGGDPTQRRIEDRLDLAHWIASPDNPLTARVMVNRVWQHHFGRGLVATPDNFGTMGIAPRQRALLDYLAHQFVASGWSVKSLQRLILLSSAYRQSSAASEAAVEKDPDNDFCHSVPTRRLEAECIRDAMLAVSGRLDRQLYGPSIPLEKSSSLVGGDAPREFGPLDGFGRRSIYLEVRRNHLPPLLVSFDFARPVHTIGLRPSSLTPAQSLQLMNSPFVHEQSRVWADRLLARPLDAPSRVERMYLEALGRRPDANELSWALGFLRQQARQYTMNSPGSAASAGDPQNPQAWADLCHVVFNLSDFIFVR